MSEWRGVFNHDDHMSNFIQRASCGRCGEWCYPHDPCSCCEKQALGDQTAAEVLAELDALRATVERVRALRERWNRDIVVTLGTPLPGGVLSCPLQSAEYALSRALAGGDDE